MATKIGRPTKYSGAIALKICTRLSKGESLRSICRDPKMPVRQTIVSWLLDKEKKTFLDQYKAARELGHSELFESLLEIADDTKMDNKVKTARDRLRVDTRKWFLSKIAPKIYGDKLELAGDKDSPLMVGFVKTVYDAADSLSKRPKK